MPIYEYECEKCGKVVEQWQKISDPPLEWCECGGPMHKLISRSSFHLKGSGWYVTDYARKGSGGSDSKKEKKGSGSSSDSSSSSSSSSSD